MSHKRELTLSMIPYVAGEQLYRLYLFRPPVILKITS